MPVPGSTQATWQQLPSPHKFSVGAQPTHPTPMLILQPGGLAQQTCPPKPSGHKLFKFKSQVMGGAQIFGFTGSHPEDAGQHIPLKGGLLPVGQATSVRGLQPTGASPQTPKSAGSVGSATLQTFPEVPAQLQA